MGCPWSYWRSGRRWGKGAGRNAETDALAAAITEHGIRSTDVVYGVDGQPNFTLPFYHGIPIRRLIGEVEMASLRTGWREVSSEVYLEFVRRPQVRLRDEPPADFIAAAGPFDLLSRRTNLAVKVVLRLNGFHSEAEDELVVFTRDTAKAGMETRLEGDGSSLAS